MRVIIAAAFLAALAAGCDLAAPPRKGGGSEAKARKEVTPSRPYETTELWNVYVTDAVVWRDQYQGRLVNLSLVPPYEIKRDEFSFYVVQPYQNGTRQEGVRVRLREKDAERLSRINRGEEKLGRGSSLLLRVAIDDDTFAFHDGEVVVRKP